MVKILIISFVVLLLLWILNIIVSKPLRERIGEDNEYFRKVVVNGNNLFYDVGGLVGIAIAYYLFSAIKWVILLFYALSSAFSLLTIVISLVPTLVFAFKDKISQINELIVIFSNTISLLGGLLILYITLHYLFNWI